MASYHRYAVLTHQTAQAAVTDIQTDFHQFFGHPWSTVTPRLRRNCSLLLSFLMPVFINIMMANPNENSCKPFYTVVE